MIRDICRLAAMMQMTSKDQASGLSFVVDFETRKGVGYCERGRSVGCGGWLIGSTDQNWQRKQDFAQVVICGTGGLRNLFERLRMDERSRGGGATLVVPSGQARNKVEKKTKASQQKGSQDDQQMKSIGNIRTRDHERSSLGTLGSRLPCVWLFPRGIGGSKPLEAARGSHRQRRRQKSSEDAPPAGDAGSC